LLLLAALNSRKKLLHNEANMLQKSQYCLFNTLQAAFVVACASLHAMIIEQLK